MATWKFTTSGLQWSAAANWDTNTVPNSNTDTAVFSALGTTDGSTVVFLAATFTVKSVSLSSNALWHYELQGGDLNLSSNTGLAQLTVSGTESNSEATIIQSRLTLTSDALVVVDGNSSLSLTGSLAGAGSFTKLGVGTMTLGAGNSLRTGAYTLSAGSLRLGSANALGTGAITFNGSATLGADLTTTVSNAITIGTSANARIAAAANQTLTLSGTLGFSGAGGAVTHFGSATETGTVLVTSSSFIIDPVNVSPISIDGGVLKVGTASLRQAMNNGDFLVTIGSAGGASIATFDLNGFNSQFSRIAGTAAGVITNSGASQVTLTLANSANSVFNGSIQQGVGGIALTKTGVGALTLSGAHTYAGTTTITGGALVLAGSGVFGATGQIIDNATLRFDNSAALTLNNVISGTGGVTTSNTAFVRLNGANTYSGVTSLFGSGIELGNNSALGTGSVSIGASGAGLRAGINGLTISNAIGVGAGVSGVIDTNGLAMTYAGVISGAGGLNKTGAGTLTLTGANTFTGDAKVTAGTLALSGNGAIDSAPTISVSSGATLDLTARASPVFTTKNLSNSGNVVVGGKILIITQQTSGFGSFDSALLGTFTGGAGVDQLFVAMASTGVNMIVGSTFANWTNGVDSITISGNDLANFIEGSSRNDSIAGQKGADTINGGFGVDVAVVNTLPSSTTITRNLDGSVTVDAGGDGVDNLRDVEFVEFAVGSVIAGRQYVGAAKNDTNKDNRSDIIWQSADGTPAIWQLDGANLVGGGLLVNPGPSFKLVGTGDFNGDRKADLLWQDTISGAIAEWQLNGTAITNAFFLPNPGPTWHAIATGDFNLDGLADIALQNDDSSVAVWTLDANGAIGAAAVLATPGTDWHLRATGDFNADGRSELVFQRDNNDVATWDLNGATLTGGHFLPNTGPGWTLKATGDFSRDGKSDMLFQHANGDVAVWAMQSSGALLAGSPLTGVIASPGAAWRVGGAGDYDGNGVSDILLQNSNDFSVAIWSMNGNNLTPNGALLAANPGPGWRQVI